jgi:hypothetical protein
VGFDSSKDSSHKQRFKTLAVYYFIQDLDSGNLEANEVGAVRFGLALLPGIKDVLRLFGFCAHCNTNCPQYSDLVWANGMGARTQTCT